VRLGPSRITEKEFLSMRTVACLSIFLLALLPACRQPEEMKPFEPVQKDYARPLEPGELALEKVSPENYPDFSRGYFQQAGLERAIDYSLEYLSKPSSRRYYPYGVISHGHVRASLEAFKELLRDVRSPEELDRRIRNEFDVYRSKGWDRKGTVFYTGYYTPIFEGRKERTGAFQYPLYGMPPDLEKDADGNILGRRTSDGRLVPYYSRREIEQGNLLAGHEIAWLKDPFEVYVVTVQGSAKLRLADGSLYELGYTANNGHEYVSVAQQMVADGVLQPDRISLQNMIRYFKRNPDRVDYYTWQNPRYVFFREEEGGPYGSIGVPVTAYRTIATDKAVFPRAALAFTDTRITRVLQDQLVEVPFQSFILDQDTGGAIRAAGRADIYVGVGDRAEAVAGRVGAEGQLYYLFLKNYDPAEDLATAN
jgi:membrane-bound lytic murein transglycosylase A